MCVAIPARVVRRLSPERVLVEQGEDTREVNVLPVPDVQVGEYVLLNLGVAVQKLTEKEAREVLEMWEQISASIIQE